METRIQDPYELRAWRDYRGWVRGGPTDPDDGVIDRSLQVAGRVAAAMGRQAWSSVRATRGGQAVEALAASAGRLATSAPVQRAVDEAVAAAEGAYGTAVEAALRTVTPDDVLAAYGDQVRGRQVQELRELPLRVLDRHRPPIQTRFAAQFALTGGVTGAAQGATSITGVLAGGALVSDVIATIALSARGIATTLAHHGYDVTGPEEHVYVLTVLEAATADGPEERAALADRAIELRGRRLVGEVDEVMLASMAQAAFSAAVRRMVHKRLGRFVPGVSGVVGAGAGYRHGRDVMEAAHYAARARLLSERWGAA